MVKIKMIEYFNQHWYKVELEDKTVKYFASVTSKLGIVNKPFLAKWRGDVGNREADMRMFEAAERGSRIHAAFDILQRGGVIIYQPWQNPAYTPEQLEEIKKENGLWAVVQYQDEFAELLKLKKFLDILKPKILMTESTVYSLKNEDAGTVDAVYQIEEGDYMINGMKPVHLKSGVYIADLKTGNVVDKNAYRQTACYAYCLKEMGLHDPIGTLIIHTGSSNRGGIRGLSTKVRTSEQMASDYREYRLASDLWLADHEDEQPETFEFPSLIKMGV